MATDIVYTLRSFFIEAISSGIHVKAERRILHAVPDMHIPLYESLLNALNIKEHVRTLFRDKHD